MSLARQYGKAQAPRPPTKEAKKALAKALDGGAEIMRKKGNPLKFQRGTGDAETPPSKPQPKGKAKKAVLQRATRSPKGVTKANARATRSPMTDEDSPHPTPALLRTPLVAPRRATPANDQPTASVAKPVSEISALVEAVDAQQATIESQGKLIDKLLARIEVMDKLLGRIVDLEKAFEELPIFELMAAANALKHVEESRHGPAVYASPVAPVVIIDPEIERRRIRDRERMKAYRAAKRAEKGK
jgi:hypothetical protein